MASLTMGLNPLSKFKGPDAATPSENCMAYDDSTGDIYTAHYVDGEWKWTSRTAEIQKYLDNLEASGLFEASAAFVNNRKILRFFYDENESIVRLNPDLRFDPTYAYYAIRGMSRSENGSYEYITGNTSSNGNVTSHLVNMDLEESVTADGTQVSVPATGALSGKVEDGNAYIVEFYDSKMTIIDIEAYQAVSVMSRDSDITPDNAIVDMEVTFVGMNSDGEIEFTQGQSVDEAEYEVLLSYGSNLKKNVTSEEANGGRLSIQGLDELDTSTITGSGGELQYITVSYQMTRTNASYASSSSYSTPNQATINPSSNTITKRIPVRIIASNVSEINSVVPAVYVKYLVDSGTGIAEPFAYIRYFAHYKDGTSADVTNITNYMDGHYFVGNQFNGTEQTIKVRIPYGQGMVNNYTLEFTVTLPSSSGASWSSNNYPAIHITRNNNQSDLVNTVVFDESNNGGGSWSGKFIKFNSSDAFESVNNTTSMSNSVKDLIKENDKYGDFEPNYVRFRCISDPTYLYTDMVPAQGTIYYKTNESHPIVDGTPMLMEMYRVVVDSSTNQNISIFLTSMKIVHSKKSSS